MQANQTVLEKLIFTSNQQYLLPLFQRTYCWERKQWQELWNDIVRLIETDPEKHKTHFVGSIVTMPTKSVPEGVTKYLLIDGQQRLTTVFIIASVLRDIAKETNTAGTLSDQIQNTILINPYTEGLDKYRLLPTQVDRASFTSIIDEINSIELLEVNKITKAYKFFKKVINRYIIDNSQISLKDILNVITKNLILVSITLDLDDNAHLVFESLNAKGEPLTHADLIRNHIFMKIHVKDQDEIYKKYWEPMQISLEENLTDFIRHYLMRGSSLIKQSEVYSEFQSFIKGKNAVDVLDELYRFSIFYERFLYPEKEPNPILKKYFERIKHLEITTAYPFMLPCYELFAKKQLDQNEFIQIIKTIENYVLRRSVCKIPTNALNKIFPSLFEQALRDKEETQLSLAVQKILSSKDYPNDEEFKENILRSSDFYKSGNNTRTKIIFESIEESFKHNEMVEISELTIEHIMPQRLTNWWKEHLGNEWETIHESLINNIGNLTLTGDNSQLAQCSFPDKKRLIKERSHLQINRLFDEYDSWTDKDIYRRAEWISKKLLEIWPYFGKGKKAHSETVTFTRPVKLSILGKTFFPETWIGVFRQTLLSIFEEEPEVFDELTEQFPSLISSTKLQSDFKEIKEGIGIFHKCKLSAEDIYRSCKQITLHVHEEIGLSTKWQVEYEVTG